jgi:hypothetical protein
MDLYVHTRRRAEELLGRRLNRRQNGRLVRQVMYVLRSGRNLVIGDFALVRLQAV